MSRRSGFFGKNIIGPRLGSLLGGLAEIDVRKNQNGELFEAFLGTNLLQNVQPIHLWKRQVQEKGIELRLVKAIESCLAVGGNFRLVTLLFESAAVNIGDDRIVFYDEQSSGKWIHTAARFN